MSQIAVSTEHQAMSALGLNKAFSAARFPGHFVRFVAFDTRRLYSPLMVASDMEDRKKSGFLNWGSADPIVTEDEGEYPPLPYRQGPERPPGRSDGPDTDGTPEP